MIGAKLASKVIEDISKSYYRPPQAPKPSKLTGGNGRKNRGDGGRSNRGNPDKGYFYFRQDVFRKAYSHRDKIPTFNNKQACLNSAKKGTKKCSNTDNKDLFHGPYGKNHESDMKTFGNAIGEKNVKNNRRGKSISLNHSF